MRLLLDTHTAIWAFDSPDRLGRRGRQLIEDPANEVLISAIVPWEIAIKMNSGKMPPHVLATDFLKRALPQNLWVTLAVEADMEAASPRLVG